MTLHARLRTETRDAHDRIEAAFDLDANLASPEAYAALLGRLHAFHSGFEAAAEPWFAGTPLARCFGRAALLQQDLTALGATPPPPWPIAACASRAEALGGLYVLEGSLLGGVVIARDVERRLGLGPETGGNAFFAGHGRDTARTWRAFCDDLEALAEPGEDEHVLKAADATYASMQECLAGQAATPRMVL